MNEDKDFAQDASKVEIQTEKGKVTLKGTVPDQETKDDIEVVAKDIAGENNVINNIVVEAVKNQ
ncbi:MAG: BON domain-containing protein [Parachlamydiaceae bacterium]|nr:MAG: BON domain-containing protein [Parachlamydiaceae bacterium]